MSSTKPCEMDEQELLVKTSSKILACMENRHGFYMSFKEVQKLFASQSACAYSGTLFSTTGDITFERVNPQLPYTKQNVVLVRKHLNELKGKTIDRFIHQSGMSDDALADLFSMLSRSLRAEAKRKCAPRVAKQPSPVNETAAEEVAENFSGKGAFLKQLLKGAQEKKNSVNNNQPYESYTPPRSRG